MEGERDSSRLARVMLETPSGHSSLFQMALNFPAFAKGGKFLLPSLFGKHSDILGAMI